MTIDLEEYKKLKKDAYASRTSAERATGALERLQAELKSDYDCDTIADAEKLLEELTKQEQAAEEEYDAALTEFREKWDDKL